MAVTDFTSTDTAIDGLTIITLKQVADERGTVRELYRVSTLAAAAVGFPGPIAQINVTETARGALRGLHAEAVTKLVAVVSGAAYGAYVDLRADSATYASVVTADLTPGTQVLVPSGVANGFQALVDGTQYLYCFDREWQPGMPGRACHPLDPALAIPWPIAEPVLSDKDRNAPFLSEVTGR